MVFGGLDHLFGCVGVTMVCFYFYILSCGVLHLYEVLDDTGALIVEYVELVCVSNRRQVTLDAVKGFHHACSLP